jgi:putative transposase
MTTLKGYKYRIYPSKEQRIQFEKTFGCVRFVYNKMLEDRIRIYNEKSGEKLPTPAKYKTEFDFLKDVDSLALANAQLDLNAAYKNFFKQGNGFPKFKKKKNELSYKTNNQNDTIRLIGQYLKVPKLKTLIKIKLHRGFTGIIKSATIRKIPSGKYYVSILVEEDYQCLPNNDNQVGVDLGISELAILSNGKKFTNPKFLKKSEKKLAFEQRKFSKMKKGSNNRERQRIKVAKIYEKITNQRKDYLHNITNYLIKNFGLICLEDLSSSNMMKNRRLAKAIQDVSWFEFQRQLLYKAEWNDRTIQKVSRWFPSSQICSSCGLKSGKKPLHIREWTCECGDEHDRDVNASKNILAEGKRILGMQ